jgi:hypothetical protein
MEGFAFVRRKKLQEFLLAVEQQYQTSGYMCMFPWVSQPMERQMLGVRIPSIDAGKNFHMKK